MQQDDGRLGARAQDGGGLEQERRSRSEVEVHAAADQRIVADGRVGAQVVAGAECTALA